MNATVTIDGNTYPVVSKKGAWTTINDNGKERKVRIKTKSDSKPKAAKPKAAKPKAAKPKAANGTERMVNPNLDKYVVTKSIKTKSGRPAIDSNDKVAKQLRGLTLDELYKAAAAVLRLTQKALHDRYDRLNPGMQRMNLGNRMRGTAGAA